MNPLLNELASRITGRSNLEACSLSELEQLAAQNPAFAISHLLLAAKSKQQGLGKDNSAIQKAKLYFQNPVWAQYILTDEDFEKDSEGRWTENEIKTPGNSPDEIEAETEVPFTHEEVVSQTPEDIQEFIEQQEKMGTAPEEVAQTPEDIQEFIEQEENTETVPEEIMEPIGVPAPVAEEEEVHLGTDSPVGTTDTGIREKLAGLTVTEPRDTDTLSFEPYHTVDYFASQGIRFKDEPREKDKFSVQLRSFTEWLKTMKRIPANEGIDLPNISEEKRVVQMAEHSIAPREVVTETMAEIWVKQGNMDKAARVYQKLSLLDPAKSAYFAAKIEQLKHS